VTKNKNKQYSVCVFCFCTIFAGVLIFKYYTRNVSKFLPFATLTYIYDHAMLMVNLSLSYRIKWGNKRARVNSNRMMYTEAMRMNN